MDDESASTSQFLISYAHESATHAAVVHDFCMLLRQHDLDVRIDTFADEDRQDWVLWTTQQIAAAERVLIVVSAEYRARFEATAPVDQGRGVRFEGALIRNEILRDMSAGLRKFVPVLLPGATVDHIPTMLGPYSCTHYVVPEVTAVGVQRVVRLLRRDPAEDPEPPPLPGTSGIEAAATGTGALRLSVAGGSPAGADDVVRAFLAAGAGAAVTEFDAQTKTVGALLIAPPEAVLAALTGVSRHLRPLLDGHNRAAVGTRMTATIGGHVADRADAAEAGAEAAAAGAAARRMHAAPGADLVLAVSPQLHRLISSGPAPYPGASSYRSWPVDGDRGDPVWIAVPGRSAYPFLPEEPPTPRPADDGHGQRAPSVIIGGANSGVVGDGNTFVYHGVINNGSGIAVSAGRDAYVRGAGRE
jgi:hypothetical protein